jgi:hypothetical protein
MRARLLDRLPAVSVVAMFHDTETKKKESHGVRTVETRAEIAGLPVGLARNAVCLR